MLGIDATIQGRAAEDCLGRDHAYRLEPKTAAVADRLARMLAFVVRGCRANWARGWRRRPIAPFATASGGAGKHLRPTAAPVRKPGTAKTHTVRTILEEEIREPYTYRRGHVTPMGLFGSIAEHRDEVIVLDDLGALLKSDVALQILLSALEHPTRGTAVVW